MEIIAVGQVPFRPQILLLESPVSLSAASLQSKLKLSIISAKQSGVVSRAADPHSSCPLF